MEINVAAIIPFVLLIPTIIFAVKEHNRATNLQRDLDAANARIANLTTLVSLPKV